MGVSFPLPWDLELGMLCDRIHTMCCIPAVEKKVLKGPQHTTIWNREAVLHCTGVVVYVVWQNG